MPTRLSSPALGAAPETKGTQGGDTTRRVALKSKRERASFRAPERELLTCGFTSIFVLGETIKVLSPRFLLSTRILKLPKGSESHFSRPSLLPRTPAPSPFLFRSCFKSPY